MDFRTIIEPFKIKSVEAIRFTTEEQRRARELLVHLAAALKVRV